LLKDVRAIQDDMRELAAKAAKTSDPQALEQIEASLRAAQGALDARDAILAPLVSFAHLYVLRGRVGRLRVRLAATTGFAVITLFVAVWAATPPKPEAKTSGDMNRMALALSQA
jgi:hypothetical protein